MPPINLELSDQALIRWALDQCAVCLNCTRIVNVRENSCPWCHERVEQIGLDGIRKEVHVAAAFEPITKARFADEVLWRERRQVFRILEGSSGLPKILRQKLEHSYLADLQLYQMREEDSSALPRLRRKTSAA